MQKDPLHKKIYVDLVGKIRDQTYHVGCLLPSENELCVAYNATRPTVRLALERLVAEGYINKEKGRGSRVLEPKLALGILSIEGTTGGIYGVSLETKIIQPIHLVTETPDLGFTNVLEGEYYTFERLRIVAGKPVLLESTYIPSTLTPSLEFKTLTDTGLFALLKWHYNIEVKGGEQKIWSISAPSDLAKTLQVAVNSPILHLKRKLETNKNTSFFSILYATTEGYCLQGKF